MKTCSRIALVLLSLLGATLAHAGRKIAPLGEADVIRLKDSQGSVLPMQEISDPARIALIRSFVNTLPDKWGVPWYGPPVGRIYLGFYRDGKVIGNFYVGPGFFGRDGGNFFSQRAKPAQLKELGSLLGLDLPGHLRTKRGGPAQPP